jgi:hypothetical protein
MSSTLYILYVRLVAARLEHARVRWNHLTRISML